VPGLSESVPPLYDEISGLKRLRRIQFVMLISPSRHMPSISGLPGAAPLACKTPHHRGPWPVLGAYAQVDTPIGRLSADGGPTGLHSESYLVKKPYLSVVISL
jgi:hypothetical protein